MKSACGFCSSGSSLAPIMPLCAAAVGSDRTGALHTHLQLPQNHPDPARGGSPLVFRGWSKLKVGGPRLDTAANPAWLVLGVSQRDG